VTVSPFQVTKTGTAMFADIAMPVFFGCVFFCEACLASLVHTVQYYLYH